MPSSSLTTGVIFALQTGVGILGNIFLLSCYILMSHKGQQLKDIYFILKNLIFANCLVLLSGGIPRTMLSMGIKHFLDDFGCKLVLYLNRVARGVSLGTTSILTCSQALKIISSSPRWMKVKATLVKYTRIVIILCWTFHTLVNTVVINYVMGPRESNNDTNIQNLGYCSAIHRERNTYMWIMVLFSSIDMICLGFMVCASGFMVFILYKHKKNVLYIQRKTSNTNSSAETRATQSIIILASIFFCFYSLSSVFTFYVYHYLILSHWLVDIASLITASYSCISPFVLSSRDPHVSRLCFTSCAKTSHLCKLFGVL